MRLCGFLQDWLFLAYQRVTGMEYGLLVATFVAIMVMGLELGIAAGIIAASLLFAYNYSKVCFSLLLRWWRADHTQQLPGLLSAYQQVA